MAHGSNVTFEIVSKHLADSALLKQADIGTTSSEGFRRSDSKLVDVRFQEELSKTFAVCLL